MNMIIPEAKLTAEELAALETRHCAPRISPVKPVF